MHIIERMFGTYLGSTPSLPGIGAGQYVRNGRDGTACQYSRPHAHTRAHISDTSYSLSRPTVWPHEANVKLPWGGGGGGVTAVGHHTRSTANEPFAC